MDKITQWMKTFQKLCFQFIRRYWAILVFSAILLIIGIIFGALAVNQLDVVQKEDLKLYLQNFFSVMENNGMNLSDEIFQLSLWNQLKTVGLIGLLGLSVVGFPIVIFLLFLKGITLGFSIGLLVYEFGFQGFWFSAGTVFLQNFMIVPLWLLMVTFSLSFSIYFVQSVLSKQRVGLGRKFIVYFIQWICIDVLFVLPSLYEAFVSPYIINYFAEHLTK